MEYTVNMLSGGLLVVTDASSATPDFVFDAIAEMTPLQKVTTIEDFSDAALFFASEQSRSITGKSHMVVYIQLMQNNEPLSESDISRIIEMAWEDRTFDAIESQYGLKEQKVKELMREHLKTINYGEKEFIRKTKHLSNRDFTVGT